ncbi:DUF4031 domain-containing protein [Chromobacterium haemolyticum]|uniref:DUF4031 domain-containing protein n=1 Tax=Chromobacterium haemolyticum TaxID=394935 RepID=UPI00244726FA|nr:DUF4031 domain-containing protein [Chromobacterium haemolyticum]MDH0342127.1 DUF4031 domain-containing protein [Chromobacterium haemolyticum]
MAVYVDDAIWPYGRMLMCHMLADTEAELHAMAERIGVARRHFQGWDKVSCAHYDICKSKRALAVTHGAIEVGRRGIVEVKRRLQANRKGWNPAMSEWINITDRIPEHGNPVRVRRSAQGKDEWIETSQLARNCGFLLRIFICDLSTPGKVIAWQEIESER